MLDLIQAESVFWGTLVPRNIWSRFRLMIRPTISSVRPLPYDAAVSTQVTPASSAAERIRSDSDSSHRSPNIIVPRHISETLTPVEPKLTYFTLSSLLY